MFRGIVMREADMIVLFEDRKNGRGSGDGEATAASQSLFGRASWRKARAVADISDGLLTPEEACERYGLEAEALAPWQRALRNFGFKTRGRKAGEE